MTMTPFDSDITQSLKWLQNNAPKIQSLVTQKNNWYNRYNTQFWSQWTQNVFDIRTANGFGLTVWCIILGLPPSLFSLAAEPDAWAYGAFRQNYVDSGGHAGILNFSAGPVLYNNNTVISNTSYTYNSNTNEITFISAPQDGAVLTWSGTVVGDTGQELIVRQPRHFGVGDGVNKIFLLAPTSGGDGNIPGGNFYGGGASTVSILSEVRYALQLRYCSLVSNGQLAWINYMLNYIFNHGDPWDFPNKKYFYLTDLTQAVNPIASPPPTKHMYMEYRVGAGLPLSDQFINLLNNRNYGIMPTIGGIDYLVVTES